MRNFLIGISVLFAAAGSQASELENKNLNGTKQFLVIPSVTGEEAAKSCGVNREEIDTSVKFVLQQSRIQTRIDYGKPFVFLIANQTFLYDTSTRICAFASALEVSSDVTISDTGRLGFATIWKRGSVAFGPAVGTKRQAADVIERLVKELVVAWSAANP